MSGNSGALRISCNVMYPTTAFWTATRKHFGLVGDVDLEEVAFEPAWDYKVSLYPLRQV